MVRLKTRYLIVEAFTGSKTIALGKDEINLMVKESLDRNHGDFGVGISQYAFQVLYFHKDTKLGVLRSTREHIKLVETCLAIITEYQGSEIRIRVARVCGSSRTCRVKLYDLSMEKLKHALSSIEWETYIQKLREEIALIDPQ